MRKYYLLLVFISLIFSGFAQEAIPAAEQPGPKDAIEVTYSNNQLFLNGFEGVATIKAYDMLGRLIYQARNVLISQNFSRELVLPKGQVFILQIETTTFKRSLRVVSQY